MAIPLYLSSELRRREFAALKELPSGSLMERAGIAAAGWVVKAIRTARLPMPAGTAVLVLCGPGDNGGDGLVCARELRRLGVDVLVWRSAPCRSPDALRAWSRWVDGNPSPMELGELPEHGSVGLVIDALYGIGISRGLDDRAQAALSWAQQHGLPVVALDVPSGLDPDHGRWVGGVAGAQCAATISFLGAKPGLYMAEGKDAAGQVHQEDLGVPHGIGQASGILSHPDAFPGLLVPRPHHSHKGSFGDVAVLGGASGMVGAALLAARAALHLGAGRVFVSALGAPELAFDPLMPELMLRPAPPAGRQVVLVAGCGLGTGAPSAQALQSAIEAAGALVLDADALNLLARSGSGLQALLMQPERSVVLTPHPAEAARLLACDVDDIQQDRVGCARRLAQAHQAIVILKGAGTVIARPAQTACGPDYAVNPTGNAALACAGTGDVLAGMVGALLTQILAARTGIRPSEAAWQAALAAVWWHGAVADRHPGGLVASDIARLAAIERFAMTRRSTAVP